MIPGFYADYAPGYVSTFSYIIYACLVPWVLGRRFGKMRTLLLEVLMGIGILGTGYLIESPSVVFYFPRLFLILGLVFLMIRITTKADRGRCLYFSAFMFVSAETATSLEWYLYYYGTRVQHVPDIWQIRLPFFISVYGLGVLLVLLWAFPQRSFFEDSDLTSKEILRIWLIAGITFFVSNLSNVYQETPFSGRDPLLFMLVHAMADLQGIILMCLYQQTLREMYSRMRAANLDELLSQMHDNYRLSRESIDLVSAKYHDLKHQIAYLRSGAATEDRVRALDQMEQEISDFEAQANTGNEILDTILMSKRLAFRREGVQITCIADGSLLKGMDEMDLSALLGNLLDNAVEAVLKVDSRDRRLIHLRVEKKRNFTVISCENTCAEAPEIRSGLPVTTKPDPLSHGYGTRSIAHIAQKYAGTATFSYRAGWFTARILLPQ